MSLMENGAIDQTKKLINKMGDISQRGRGAINIAPRVGKQLGGPMSTARRDMTHGYYQPDMGMQGGQMLRGGGAVKNKGYKHGGRIGKQVGGRTNLLEEVGRIDAERPNPNRIAEKRRVIGELNRGYKTGGRVGLKKGGSDKNWIQKAVNPKHKGYCTPMSKKTCTPKRKALARTFKKMARKRKG